MCEIHDRAEATIPADPGALFTRITDLERLPDWNKAIERVIDLPDALTPGASWTVQMHPSHAVRWKSVSTLSELNREAFRSAAQGSSQLAGGRNRTRLEHLA
jgi:uncharacterized membrane protein